MKYQKMINLIAATGLILGPVGAIASPGWAFDHPNVPVVERGTGSSENLSHHFDDEHGAGWAFDHPNEPVMMRDAGSGQKQSHLHNDTYGAGWAFDHPNVSKVDQESGLGPS